MDEAVARYRVASEVNGIDGVMGTLAADVELVSPISGRLVFRGHDDLRDLLSAVYGSITGLRWREAVGHGSVRVVMGEASVGPVKLGDAMVLELAGSRSGSARRSAATPGGAWRAFRRP